jgi:hypothetical protein
MIFIAHQCPEGEAECDVSRVAEFEAGHSVSFVKPLCGN